MSDVLESLLMSHVYGLEKLKAEFVEIVSKEAPSIDRTVEAAGLLCEAIDQFGTFLATAKAHALEQLVPDPKDEVQIGKTRVLHRMVANKKLDGPAWDAAVLADDQLAALVAEAEKVNARLKEAQAPFKLPSFWVEFKAAKNCGRPYP